MRISELAAAAGLPVASLKFYLREGLLPPGEATARNQANYGPQHLERLKLIGTLQGVGGLSLAAIKAVLEALDSPHEHPMKALAATVDRLGPQPEAPPAEAAAWVQNLVARMGWRSRPEASARARLAWALHRAMCASQEAQNEPPDLDDLVQMAQGMDGQAAQEVALVAPQLLAGGPEAIASVVRGIVLWEPVLLELRRLAEEHHSGLLLGFPEDA